MFAICSLCVMTNLEHSRLVDHLDAALATLAPATAARLTHPERSQRRSAIAIMAQTLAARLNGDRQPSNRSDFAALPRLQIDLS
jgi:hypothetical protein